MYNNLLLILILRETGIDVNAMPKIHFDNPSVEDNKIYMKEDVLWMTFKLLGVF